VQFYTLLYGSIYVHTGINIM